MTIINYNNFPIKFQHGKLGVIFIDCWDQPWFTEEFYLNIRRRLRSLPVTAKVFNTSFMQLDIITQETVNFLKAMPQSQAVKDLIYNIGPERLSRHLYSELDSTSILIPTYNGFSQYIEMSGIGQWIVMGAHWGLCTHTKPLGFYNLIEYKKSHPHANFYADPNCIFKWVNEKQNIATRCDWDDFEKDHLNWSRLGDLARLEL